MPRAKNGSSTKIGVIWQKSDFWTKNRNFGPKKRLPLLWIDAKMINLGNLKFFLIRPSPPRRVQGHNMSGSSYRQRLQSRTSGSPSSYERMLQLCSNSNLKIEIVAKNLLASVPWQISPSYLVVVFLHMRSSSRDFLQPSGFAEGRKYLGRNPYSIYSLLTRCHVSNQIKTLTSQGFP